MRNVALVLGLLALAACSSSSEDSADSLTAAVKKGDAEKTDAPKSDLQTPEEEALDDTFDISKGEQICEQLRNAPSRESHQIDWFTNFTGDPPSYSDLRIELDEATADNGDEVYVATLIFSSVRNSGMYAQVGAFPMQEKTNTFSGGFSSPTKLANPWTAQTFKGEGDDFGFSECKNGQVFPGEGSLVGLLNFIHIKSIVGDIAEGSFERRLGQEGDNGTIANSGTFSAPVTINTTVKSKSKHRVHQNKALCCKLAQ